jgi:hypothetical protein
MNAIEMVRTIPESGRVIFNISDHYWIRRDECEDETDYLRECIRSHLHPVRMFVSRRFDRTKIGFKEVNVKRDGMHLSFDIRPVLSLPDTHQAVLDFHDFLLATRPFFTSFCHGSPCVRISNYRDHHRRTYAALHALYWEGNDVNSSRAEIFESHFDQLIEKSPYLKQWFRNVALDLNRLGPHSWLSICSDHVFDEDDPVRGFRVARRIAEKEAEANREKGDGHDVV